ncbi:transporter [Acidobacteria bacterium AH-259-G07]|nr:transporter [Acidobacteria bacterium AH-259-G07]
MNRIEEKTMRQANTRKLARTVGALLSVGCLMLGSALGAATGKEGAGKAPDPSAELAEAQRQIAGLEDSLSEVRQALRRKEEELEAAKKELEATKSNGVPLELDSASPSGTPASYAFDPQDEEFRFLDLGVRKNYIRYESDRLVDQLRTAIPPIYEPAFSPFHGYTLPARAFRITVSNDRFINHNDFGRDEYYAAFFNKLKVENQHVSVNAFYGLDANNTLRVTVPFKSTTISGTGEAFRIRPMVMTMEGHAFGLGDTQVMLKHKWFDQGYRRFTLATAFGVQLPTGQSDNKFNDSQTIFMNGQAMPVSAAAGGPKVDLFSDDQRLPNSAQPGTGSWGLNLGVMATRQLTWNGSRGAIHGGVMYRAMKKNGKGVRPGNELIFGVSYVRPPLKSDHLSFDLTFFGKKKQSERFPGLITHPEADPVTHMPIMNPDGTLKMFTTPRPPFEHGTIMFLSPSIIIIPKSSLRVTISPMFRVYEPKRGPSPAFRLIFGIQTIF